MTADPQNDYRSARRAFVALCQKAGSDSIGRVHPWALAPDGKPLFIDSAALGPREAKKALLVITGRDGRDGPLGAAVLQVLLQDSFRARPGRRLVLVHALNPFGCAWGKRENEDGLSLDRARQSWSLQMLGAILTEDLARCEKLRVLDVAQGRKDEVRDASRTPLARMMKKPGLDLKWARLTLQPRDAGFLARKVVASALK